jgi:glycerol-3-phosphate dehydrogenase (NAD(P)+)
MRIAVLGAGSWGTTLAIVLAENDHAVTLWDRDDARAMAMSRQRENAVFLPGVTIPAGVTVTSRMAEALQGAELVVFVVPTHLMRETARAAHAAGGLGEDAIVVSASKGLEEGTLARMSEVLTDELGTGRVVSLVGPSHAEEVSRGVPTSIVAAGRDEGVCQTVQDAFVRTFVFTPPTTSSPSRSRPGSRIQSRSRPGSWTVSAAGITRRPPSSRGGWPKSPGSEWPWGPTA